MIDINGLIIFTFVVAIIGVLVVRVIRQALSIKRAMATITQLLGDKDMLLQQLERVESNRAIEKSEEFLQFLNKSRDDAYKYIDLVIASVEEFSKNVEPHIKENADLLMLVNDLYDKVMPENPDT